MAAGAPVGEPWRQHSWAACSLAAPTLNSNDTQHHARHLLSIAASMLKACASLVAQMVKNLSSMRETQVRSLGREGPLEKEMVIHSSLLAWRIAWTEELSKLQPRGHKESDTTERLALSLSLLLPPTSSKLPSLFIGTISVTFSLITHSNFSSPTQPSLRPFTFTY